MKERQLYRTGVVCGIPYTCEFCTDHIDPTKTEEILQRVTKIISESLQRRNRISVEERAGD